MSELKTTPLYACHESLGAKMAPFGGYLMPIQYRGILEEHKTCRSQTAIFDTCHMGEFFLSGPSITSDLEQLLSCSVESLQIGQCRYGFLCNPQGGIIDDQILYRLNRDNYMMVVNAATEATDFQWISSHISAENSIKNRTTETAKIDIQGPGSAKMVERLLDKTISDLTYFRCKENQYKERTCIVSRTGYTGEIGFEIYLPAELATDLWNEAIDKGAIPAGLGARDTLRLEMGMPLYGHELDPDRSPLETGFERSVKKTPPFIGSKAIRSRETSQELCGVVFEGRQKPQEGEQLFSDKGTPIGIITSGGFSPSLSSGVALAYVDKHQMTEGQEVHIKRKRKDLKGVLSSLPLYKRATGKMKLASFL